MSESEQTSWKCEIGVIDPHGDGDLAIFDMWVETPDVREAIIRACADYPHEEIERLEVRRVR